MGDAAGDGSIGGNSEEYNESENVDIDFGTSAANQTLTILYNVEIDGSWNYDGSSTSITDDYWEIRVNGTANTRFFYNSNLLGNDGNGNPISQIVTSSDTLLSSGTNITFSTPGSENSNLNTFQHTFQHNVTLDSSGQATLGFAAATTAMSETAKITSIEYLNASTYTYVFSYSTSLNDTDGSETLTLKVTNIPEGQGLTLSSGNGYTLTDNNDGTYTVTGFASSSTSVSDTITLAIITLSEPDFSTVQIEATATESSNSDSATTTASVSNTPNYNGRPELDSQRRWVCCSDDDRLEFFRFRHYRHGFECDIYSVIIYKWLDKRQWSNSKYIYRKATFRRTSRVRPRWI